MTNAMLFLCWFLIGFLAAAKILRWMRSREPEPEKTNNEKIGEEVVRAAKRVAEMKRICGDGVYSKSGKITFKGGEIVHLTYQSEGEDE